MKKEHVVFLVFFLIITILMFWDVASLKTTFAVGDYLQQFYPWSLFYSNSIKHLSFPLWAEQVQSGYAIFAEGQTAMLYPVNLIMFFFLPFKIAYNYSFILYFISAAFFMYIYSREIGLKMWGSLIAAIILCFGTTYGGSFINIATLRALSVFPLILYAFERYCRSSDKELRFFLIIGFLWGIQLLSGSIQMTFYNILFCLAYFFLRAINSGKKKTAVFLYTVLALIIAFLLSIPQIWYTMELASYSSRVGIGLKFALWNSFNPMALTGMVLPVFGSVFVRGNIIYIGLLGLFFVIVGMLKKNNIYQAKTIIAMLIISMFVAFGKYNPLYVVILKIFHFYSFRVPAKTIYFITFNLAVLAGIGFDEVISLESNDAVINKAKNLFLFILAGVIAMFFSVKLILRYFGANLLKGINYYVTHYIYGSPNHRYSLEYYLSKARQMFEALPVKMSLSNPYIILGLINILIVIGLILLLRAIRRYKLFKYFCVILVLVDLSILSFYYEGPRTSTVSFDRIQPSCPKMLNVLKTDRSIYRIFPFGKKEDLPNWAYFSMNMAYGLDSIGLYTPLMNRDYYGKLKYLGVVDDSMGALTPQKESLEREKVLLKKLNVKYIISEEQLNEPFLENIMDENGVYLYLLKGYYPRVWFYSDGDPDENSNMPVDLLYYGPGCMKVKIHPDNKGWLVFSEKYYPGWKAYVNGDPVSIHKYLDIMQEIEILPGDNSVIFRYEPSYFKNLVHIHIAMYILLLISGIYFFIKRK